MPDIDWLTNRPIAHRGLHDAATGIIENTASSVMAAANSNYGIEVDLQISADGEAMVYHDDKLGRLTEGDGALADMSASDIKAVPFKSTADRIMTLGELCDLVGGNANLLLELKSRFDGDMRLAARAAQVLRSYAGPVAIMSFDPDLIASLRRIAPQLIRGIVAQRHYRPADWPFLTSAQRLRLTWMLHAPVSRPMFIAYGLDGLSSFVPLAANVAAGLPLLTWTVRTPADRERARRYAEQIIFEGFRA